MKDHITRVLTKEIHNKTNKVVLCVGTSKCIGDSLGPKVGQILSEKINKKDVYVFGNLKQNLDYKNINIVLKRIYENIEKPYLIVIDSALSNSDYIGNIIVNKNQIIIGSGLDKNDYKLGNISIKGVVGKDNKDKFKNFINLYNVKEELIDELSNIISNQIINTIV